MHVDGVGSAYNNHVCTLLLKGGNIQIMTIMIIKVVTIINETKNMEEEFERLMLGITKLRIKPSY